MVKEIKAIKNVRILTTGGFDYDVLTPEELEDINKKENIQRGVLYGR